MAAAKDEVVTLGCEHYPSLVTYVGDEQVEFIDGKAEVSPEAASALVGKVDEHAEIVELGRGPKPKATRRSRSRSVPPVDGAGRTDQASTARPTQELPDEIENGKDGLHGAEPIDGPSTVDLASTSVEGTDGAEAVGDDATDPAVPNAPSGDPADTTDAGNVGPTA